MSKQDRKQRDWFQALLSLSCLLVGMSLLFKLIMPTLYDGWRMSDWQSTEAELLSANLVEHPSPKGGVTYSIEVGYRFIVENQSYQNTRVSLHIFDNSPSKGLLGKNLEYAYQTQAKVDVWYDPNNPADAILDRELHYGEIAFVSLFFMVFSGVGLALVYFGLRKIPPSPDQ